MAIFYVRGKMECDRIAYIQAFSATWVPELCSGGWQIQHKVLTLLEQQLETKSRNSLPIK